MNHSTILITRRLSDEDAARLREKLRELWPGDEWTIVFGEMETAEPPRAGPREWKDNATWSPDSTTATPVPRYES